MGAGASGQREGRRAENFSGRNNRMFGGHADRASYGIGEMRPDKKNRPLSSKKRKLPTGKQLDLFGHTLDTGI